MRDGVKFMGCRTVVEGEGRVPIGIVLHRELFLAVTYRGDSRVNQSGIFSQRHFGGLWSHEALYFYQGNVLSGGQVGL